GTQVERADTAALQLLCALFQDAEADHWDVQWHQPSVALQNAAQLLNVSAHLALPAA
ncbi:MAG: STAS domain-containing protein, partial [Candidatus Tectomicrobia bacterium]|nr:STAS domain-containing protein [Candidatus Tectomicrobia bacterium]